MLDLHEELGASQAERGGLRGELQHMEVLQCKALEEAQEKSRGVVVRAVAFTLTHHVFYKVRLGSSLAQCKLLGAFRSLGGTGGY